MRVFLFSFFFFVFFIFFFVFFFLPISPCEGKFVIYRWGSMLMFMHDVNSRMNPIIDTVSISYVHMGVSHMVATTKLLFLIYVLNLPTNEAQHRHRNN